MADSLDDFFAKKDKKRGRDKGKAAFSAEALVRELEEGSKQLDFPVRKENKTSTAIELLGLDADDADWRDFEDVEKRDYTGLKVKEMSLQDQNEEEQRRLSSEQSETLPDSTPWRIKPDEPSSATPDSISKAKAANVGSGNSKVPDPTKSDTSTVSSSTDKPEQQQPAGVTSKESSDSTEKKGDKPSATKVAYVPPQGRASEFKVLEPVRLSKTRNVGGGKGHSIDIQDKRAFPSLG